MNLQTTIDFDIKRFFTWWGQELSSWLPEKLRRTLNPQLSSLIVTISDDEINIRDEQSTENQPLILKRGDQVTAENLSTINPLSNQGKNRYIVRLTEQQATKRILFLPEALKKELNQVMCYEMDRYTPFHPDEVYFAVKLLDITDNGQIKVLLVVTPKDTLDLLLTQLKQYAIQPVIVDYEGAKNTSLNDKQCYNLLPEQEKTETDKKNQRIIWFLSITAFILSVSVLIFPLWQQTRQINFLQQQFNPLRKEMDFVQAKQLEIDQLMTETQHLLALKKQAPSLLYLINQLSQLIPTDTSLTYFKYHSGQLQIQGQSPAASALIGILENSPLFSQVKFTSPLTRDKKTGLERFQISIHVTSKEATNES